MAPEFPASKGAHTPRLRGATGPAAAAVKHMATSVSNKGGVILLCTPGAQTASGYAACEMLDRSTKLLQPWTCVHADHSPADPADTSSTSGRRCIRSRSGQRVHDNTKLMTLDELADTCARCAPDVTVKHDVRPTCAHGQAGREGRIDAPEDQGLALISHELKQPLTAQMIQLERLLEMADAAEIPEMLDAGRAMQNAIRRQARLIDDLLELSRTRTGKLKLELDLVDLDNVIREICNEAGSATRERHLRVDIERQGVRLCMADPVRLEQIFSNLLHNAVKFSQVGGHIDVRVTCVDRFAKVSVADDGCGISAEFLPKVFHMFGQERRTAHSVNAGLGIGLALVYELTKAHGGHVEVHSNGPGHGAQFTILLPLADRSALLPSGLEAFSHAMGNDRLMNEAGVDGGRGIPVPPGSRCRFPEGQRDGGNAP